MELKYLTFALSVNRITGSNRTFMELKYYFQEKSEKKRNVLIVPLWN